MLESRIGTGMFDLCFRNGIERQMAQSRAGIEQAHMRRLFSNQGNSRVARQRDLAVDSTAYRDRSNAP